MCAPLCGSKPGGLHNSPGNGSRFQIHPIRFAEGSGVRLGRMVAQCPCGRVLHITVNLGGATPAQHPRQHSLSATLNQTLRECSRAVPRKKPQRILSQRRHTPRSSVHGPSGRHGNALCSVLRDTRHTLAEIGVPAAYCSRSTCPQDTYQSARAAGRNRRMNN